MDTKNPEELDERLHAETPEDVAVLYSWANLQGAKYRDFSAARREYRAQMRKKAAETQREEELRAKTEAETSAAAAERAAREAEEAARFHESAARKAVDELRPHDSQVEQQARARAIQHASELSRLAAAERMEAARRAEAVAAAEAAARREAREMTEARASAERQAQRYAESESIRRALAGPQPEPTVHGAVSDPYTEPAPASRPERTYKQPSLLADDMKASRLPKTREERFTVPQPEDSAAIRADHEYWKNLAAESKTEAEPEAVTQDIPLSPVNYYYEPDSQEKVAAVDQYAHYTRFSGAPATEAAPEFYPGPAEEAPAPVDISPRGYQPDESSGSRPAYPGQNRISSEPRSTEATVPQWLHAPDEERPLIEPRLRPLPPPVADTLHHSRERVAARWFALKGIFDQGVQEMHPDTMRARQTDARTPVIAVFSIAGGVGKTSMVATLGRALSAQGEQVLLADTTSHGLLPYYFGASELRPNVVRTFSPPSGHSGSPLALVGFDVSEGSHDTESQERFISNLERNASHVQRVLVDLAATTPWVMRRLARMNSVIIVPVSPDMNSVISLGPVEKFFSSVTDADERPILPFYLLNQFDASLPLHLDVREVMHQQLGDRLLPFVIRRSPAMAESLGEGMTVIDYAPDSSVAGDYLNLANWLRTQSLQHAGEENKARWGER